MDIGAARLGGGVTYKWGKPTKGWMRCGSWRGVEQQQLPVHPPTHPPTHPTHLALVAAKGFGAAHPSSLTGGNLLLESCIAVSPSPSQLFNSIASLFLTYRKKTILSLSSASLTLHRRLASSRPPEGRISACS